MATAAEVKAQADAAAASQAAAAAALADAQAAANAASASAAMATAAAIQDLRVSSDGRGIIQYQTGDGTWHDSTLTASAFLAAASPVQFTDSSGHAIATLTGTAP